MKMKVDLHVHSRYSKRPSQWILQKLGCPESFTEPLRVHRIAKEKGMSLVTLTDHNSISGCLEIAHLPDVFISEEVTTYFPQDQCKAHVLVHNIDESIHQDIQKVRENIFDLVAYLQENQVIHVLAHPLFAVNDRLTIEHFEQFLLLFRNFELNGARHDDQNRHLRLILSQLTPTHIERLVDKHGITPRFDRPWQKYLTGGSDDHSSLTIARQYTEIPATSTAEDFLGAIETDRTRIVGRPSTAKTMAHNLYGIAYQFYKNKFNLERHVSKDLFLRFLDGFLQSAQNERGLVTKLYSVWNQRKWSKNNGAASQKVQDVLRHETLRLIWDDPDLMDLARNGNSNGASLDKKWFQFVNRLSNKVLYHFGSHILDQVSGANFFTMFHSIGSAGALYSLLAPYFLAFSMFSREKQLAEQILQRFTKGPAPGRAQKSSVSVAHFTDTYYEVNGVALTLQHQVEVAQKTNKQMTVITCHAENRSASKGVQNFQPVGVHEVPEYPELKLFVPPFLEMLDYCYEEGFTQIHSATPGPIGLAALAIARILKLPISGTYHTALPQYAQYLTGDANIEDIMWRFTIWYYDQMDYIYVPSKSTAQELIEKGIRPERIKFFPRGVDIRRFHPSKRNPRFLRDRFQIGEGLKLLYVGRVSKEKNLPLLAEVFKELCRTQNDLQLIIVGDGPFLREMQESMQGTPCTFTGYLEGEDLATVYASCDLFVFPSTTDTFGNVVLEAQASGIPVVVTDSGGPQENIIPDETGLVARGDNAESFLYAIRWFIRSPQSLTQMGEAARRYMEQRSFESAFDETWGMCKTKETEVEWSLDEAI
jgi:glycosyltransferase involved in cell wall biosynthesis